MIKIDNLQIFVVANPHRKPLIKPHLKDVDAYFYKTPDYVVPKHWKSAPKWQYIYNAQGMKGANGHLRCNRGHQDCLKMLKKPHALMFEDDAVPNDKRWINIVRQSISLLKDFEVISLHGRMLQRRYWTQFQHKGRSYLKPKKQKSGDVFCCGSLAYLIRKEAAEKMVDFNFTGMPQDMTICNKFTFCVIEKSPFLHDRRQGSLIE